MTIPSLPSAAARGAAACALALGAAALLLPAAGAAQTPRRARPVLAFPEEGLDDSTKYLDYRTRIYRDAAANTAQLYLDGREGRVVQLWADADNASAAFTVRGADDRPAVLDFDAPDALVGRRGRARTLEHRLRAPGRELRVGQFLLGTMRVERDFQYEKRNREPLATPSFVTGEFTRLTSALAQLPADRRPAHLAALGARSVPELEARLRPTVQLARAGADWRLRVVQPALDARDTLAVELLADAATLDASLAGGVATFRRRGGGDGVPVRVRFLTTGRTLHALERAELFRPEYLAFLDGVRRRGEAPGAAAADRVRARRLERQTRGVELLVSREKLMAGLPTYATYFGRDMLVTALMMRPVWRPELSEFAIASALARLSPGAEVSHEEAIGAQASREAAAEYAALVDSALAGGPAGGRVEALLARARTVLAAHRTGRENYHMVDDEFQLPVLVAAWLGDSTVPAARQREFLDRALDGRSQLARILDELAVVARLAAPYAADPRVERLIGFPRRSDGGFASASWRDSGAGYGGGRYAMDVNALWVPEALAATRTILTRLAALGYTPAALERVAPAALRGTELGRLVRDPAALDAAASRWREAGRHFVRRLGPAELDAAVERRLAAGSAAESGYWRERISAADGRGDSLIYMDVALDSAGRPVNVANTDVATALFLSGAAESGAVAPGPTLLDQVRLFTRPFPVGLLVPRVGPVVANDTHASAAVQQAFARDPYHGPRVVWGREVNLFVLGAAAHAERSADPAVRRELLAAIDTVRREVEASGFGSELWSYDFGSAGRPVAERYGSGGDVQLWSTTDLAVEFVLDRLRAARR